MFGCLRAVVCRAFHSRWTTLLSVATQDSLAASLVEEGVALLDGVGVASHALSSAEALLDLAAAAALGADPSWPP